MKPPRCLCSPSCREGAFSESAHNGWHPPLMSSSPYRPPGRSSPGGGSSRRLDGAVGVSPCLSGRSSPGGGSSVGGPSSALGGAGGTTPLEAQLLRLLPVPPVGAVSLLLPHATARAAADDGLKGCEKG